MGAGGPPPFPLAGIIPCSNADRRGGSGDEIEKGLVHIDTEKRIDWNVIRAKYVGGISIYQLAKDYGISTSTIHKHAKRGEWEEERERTAKEARKRTIEKAAEAAADNATIAANIKRRGLLVLERLFNEYDISATERRETKGGKTDVLRLRDLTAAYKDLTGDIVQSDTDNALLQSLMDLERGRQ